jgi:hypothetical protein
MKKFTVSFADSLRLKDRPDANLLLLCNDSKAGLDFDVRVIRFQSRLALESFNKKAGLRAVIRTQVPLNCAIYKHESDSDARKTLAA